MQKEWQEFRHRLNDEVAKHFQVQELLVLDFLGNMEATNGAARRGEGLANAGQTGLSLGANGSKQTWLPGESLHRADEPDQHRCQAQGLGPMLISALSPLEKSVSHCETMLMRQQPGWRSGSNGNLPGDASRHTPSDATSTRPSLTHRGTLFVDSGAGCDENGSASGTHQEMFAQFAEWTQQQSLWHRAIYQRCSGVVDWFLELREPERMGVLANIVTGKKFETLCATVIIANAAVSMHAINREVEAIHGGDVFYKPSAFVTQTEIFFVAFYTVELFLKLWVHKWYYFCNLEWRWNVFDCVLVVFALVDQVIMKVMESATQEKSSTTNMTFMRTLRILKMARILRGLRVMRFFYELRLMLNSLIGSMSSLFWSIVMLLLIYYIFALVFVQAVSNHLLDVLTDGDESTDVDSELMLEFGLVQRAVLALYKASTGGEDWNDIYVVIAQTGVLYAGTFILFIAFSHIALWNILTAIFVQRAMKLVQPDRETQALEQRIHEMEEFQELRQIVRAIDSTGSGYINIKDLRRMIAKDPKLGAQLSILGLSFKDTQLFLNIVASSFDGDEISIEEFIEGCMRMRGYASAIDVHQLTCQIHGIQATQWENHKLFMDRLDLLTERIEYVPVHVDVNRE